MAVTQSPPQVFISHNAKDKPLAREIAVYLVAADCGVWFDEWEIRAGDSIVGKVDNALAACTDVLIVWSEDAAGSEWVTAELEAALARAMDNEHPRIILIKTDETAPPELLRARRYIDWSDNPEAAFNELVRSITGESPGSSLRRAVVQKYRDLIYDDSPPFGLAACPTCGSERLRGSTMYDKRDDVWYVVECEECGWSDATQ